MLFSGQNIFPFQNFLPCNLVRVHSLGGTIRSIYLYPVPTLLLHDKKEINVVLLLWNMQEYCKISSKRGSFLSKMDG